MMYKTSSPDHRPSAGVLMDLIRQYGVNSEEVTAYVDKFANDEAFMKKASILLGMGKFAESVKNPPKLADKTTPEPSN